ncbi:hypothetical protein ACFX2H_010586 [Malus domestica]
MVVSELKEELEAQGLPTDDVENDEAEADDDDDKDDDEEEEYPQMGIVPCFCTTHSLGYVFGSPLYDEIISLCLDLVELDAAVAIVADMETTGISPRRDIGPGDFC